jgi:hypothetical protein
MLVCPNCFSDKEIIGFITASGKTGDCDVCGTTPVPVMDVSEFFDFFQELLVNYEKSETGIPLKSKIQEYWNFFFSMETATTILNEILDALTTDITSTDDLVDYTEDILQNHAYWEILKNNIKWKNRFLLDQNVLIEDLGWDGYFNTQYELNPDNVLYRARVHHKSGLKAYDPKDMMCPKPNDTKGGRANPSGIPHLYLSDNSITVLHEVRGSLLDELSIGKFRLKQDLEKVKIVDFTEDTPLFQPNSVNETIKARLLRDRISEDLSKPMRRYDTEIEYVPTQFICEFIRVITNVSGIRFKSSVHPLGENLVIFDQEIMECTEVTLHQVDNMDLTAKAI